MDDVEAITSERMKQIKDLYTKIVEEKYQEFLMSPNLTLKDENENEEFFSISPEAIQNDIYRDLYPAERTNITTTVEAVVSYFRFVNRRGHPIIIHSEPEDPNDREVQKKIQDELNLNTDAEIIIYSNNLDVTFINQIPFSRNYRAILGDFIQDVPQKKVKVFERKIKHLFKITVRHSFTHQDQKFFCLYLELQRQPSPPGE
jgi:hypothetical protein